MARGGVLRDSGSPQEVPREAWPCPGTCHLQRSCTLVQVTKSHSKKTQKTTKVLKKVRKAVPLKTRLDPRKAVGGGAAHRVLEPPCGLQVTAAHAPHRLRLQFWALPP